MNYLCLVVTKVIKGKTIYNLKIHLNKEPVRSVVQVVSYFVLEVF